MRSLLWGLLAHSSFNVIWCPNAHRTPIGQPTNEIFKFGRRFPTPTHPQSLRLHVVTIISNSETIPSESMAAYEVQKTKMQLEKPCPSHETRRFLNSDSQKAMEQGFKTNSKLQNSSRPIPIDLRKLKILHWLQKQNRSRLRVIEPSERQRATESSERSVSVSERRGEWQWD